MSTRGLHEQLLQADPLAEGDQHSFNLGNMVFLPKKIAGSHDLFGEYYTANDVRPLVLVNTDNRLIANAMRIRLEQFSINGFHIASVVS